MGGKEPTQMQTRVPRPRTDAQLRGPRRGAFPRDGTASRPRTQRVTAAFEVWLVEACPFVKLTA